MIKNIKELKNIGIFNHYIAPSQTPLFRKYNLIYGWNGSGKSTLSNLMYCFGDPGSFNQFPEGKFKIELENGNIITEKDFERSNTKVKVFNQKFIEDNIDWKGKLNPILYISHEKIELKKEYDDITERIRLDKANKSQLETELEVSRKEDDKFKQAAAKNIKTVFQTIETADQKYLNYNKRNIDSALTDGLDLLLTGDKKLTDDEYTNIVKSLKPNRKEEIIWNAPKIQKDKIIKAENKIIEILKTKISANVIEKLASNPELSNWVETGMKIHTSKDTCHCEFCGGIVSKERLQKIEQHFNKEYDEFKSRIAAAIEWIKTIKLDIQDIAKDVFYDELQQQFNIHQQIFIECTLKFNTIVEDWIALLLTKHSNPFNEIIITEREELGELCDELVQSIEAIEGLVKTHNLKTDDFSNLLLQNKKSLEGHLISQHLQDFNYGQFKTNSSLIESKLTDLTYLLKLKETRYLEIEKELVSESLAADDFNKDLSKFLGRDEIKLSFNTENKGYDIVRPNGNGGFRRATNLSEGEKTAIAFIYFVTSLKSKGNNLAECVIWIDDPISSFDSNHLFNAQIFIEKKCAGACQIFITTHNFWFFKVVRDWFKRCKKKETTLEGQKIEISLGEVFRITSSTDNGLRSSHIREAGKALSNFHSEYHFLFKTLHESIHVTAPDYSGAFQLANLSRRLLESFLSFKYPNETNGFSNLMERVKTFDHEKKERIKWFLNKFSHSDRIEVLDNLPENLIEEGYSVARETFCLIEAEDKSHYDNMLKACNN